MLGPISEQSLHFECPLVVAIGRGRDLESSRFVKERAMIDTGLCGEPVLEEHGRAQGNLAGGDASTDSGGHRGFGQPDQRACVDEVRRSCHSVATPGTIGNRGVEALRVSDQRDEVEPTLGIDYLTQRSINGLSQGRGSEDLCCLHCDISINIYRCLRRTGKISH